MTDTSSYPIPGSASSMTPERRLWMRAVLSCEEAGNPGVEWHEWLGSALLALDSAVLRDPLTATWMDGPPPKTEPGKPVYVWRDGCDSPVPVMFSEGDRWLKHGMHWLPPENRRTGRFEPWGTARWAPIPKPSDKVPAVPATPDTSPTVVLDSMTVEQIKAYLKQRKEQAWLAHGCGDGFERLLVDVATNALTLPEGCWVWKNRNGQIRLAFGWIHMTAIRKKSYHKWPYLLWFVFDDNERCVGMGHMHTIPTQNHPIETRTLNNLAWLAEVRAWLLAQPIERTG